MSKGLKIICNAEGYKYKQNEHGVIVYNELYEKTYVHIFIMIVASLLVPDPEFAFKMPIAVCIRAQSTDKITVSEKLQVFGTEDFFYFIPQKHFGMWRKTSLVTIVGISSFILLMDLLLWYRFFIPADTSYGVYNPLIAVCGVFLAVIAILFLIRAKKQYSLKNSFPIRDDIVI